MLLALSDICNDESPVLRLVATSGPFVGKGFSLSRSASIGRSSHNHIVIDEPSVSRQHATVSVANGTCFLRDLNSANGTFVNEDPVVERLLSLGDTVRIGSVLFRVETEAKPHVFHDEDTDVPTILLDGGSVKHAMERLQNRLRTRPNPSQGPSRLEALYSFLEAHDEHRSEDELAREVGRYLLEAFVAAHEVAIFLRDPRTLALRARHVLSQNAQAPEEKSFILPDVVVRGGRPFRGIIGEGPTGEIENARQAIVVPVIFGSSLEGVLYLTGPQGADGTFTSEDVDTTTAIASLFGVVLQMIRMKAESLEQKRFERDLKAAGEIQKSFLPRKLPIVPGIDFVTAYEPAYAVGGDFYDLFWLSDRKVGLFIGDVSGKGIAAALLMARVSNDLRTAAFSTSDPSVVLSKLNQAVLDREHYDIFVTGIYMSLDVKTRALEFANAGHMSPLVRRKNALLRLSVSQGAAIGLVENETYELGRFQLEPDDVALLFTDGVIEAMNQRDELYGEERLERSIREAGPRAIDVAANVLESVKSHIGPSPERDDLTLLVMGVSGTA